MKAIKFYKFGEPSVLEIVESPIPQPGNDEVLIKVHAASVNPIDYKTRNGSGFVARQLENHLPAGLGYDFSGEVIKVGKKVKNLKIGCNVMGIAGFPNNPGCYAEYISTSIDTITLKPENISFIQAAALPTVGLTALQALNQAEVKKDTVTLIHAGAGGVGHIAIQLAKLRGAVVIATASKRNHEFLKTLGANYCIDYSEECFQTSISSPIDVVIDLVGGSTGLKSIECLSPQGCIVTVPTITADQIIQTAKQKSRHAFGLIKESNMQELQELAMQISNGLLKIEISRVFPLADAALAHQLLEAGHVRGKLVLKI